VSADNLEGFLLDKRLTAFDYFVSLVIILLIVANVASFFFGVRYGANEMETKYLAIINKDKKPDRSKDSYHQEHIVSYYYNIFEPTRMFEEKWFTMYDALLYKESVGDIEDQLDQLRDSVNQEYDRVRASTMPASSSYLVDAQKNALKSLTLFKESLAVLSQAASTVSQDELLKRINKEPNYIEARNFALLARQMYFTAIVEWNKTINSQLKGVALVNKKDVSIAEWKSMNLNLKAQTMSQLMTAEKHYTLALPLDYVGKLDEMVRTGQAESLNLKTAGGALQTLISTKAVRNGDFPTMKEKFYGSEFLPALPFYSELR
jgi:hypothetical protein